MCTEFFPQKLNVMLALFRAIRALILCTLYACIIALPCAADSQTIFGLNFPVDELRDSELGFKKVVVAGEARIVPNDKVQEFIVTTTFSRKAALGTFTFDQIAAFVRDSVQGKTPRLAAAALQGILQSSDPNDPKIAELVETVASNPQAVDALKIVLSSLTSSFPSSRIVCVLLYSIGSADSVWLRANAVKLLYIFGGELKLFLKEHYYRAVVDLSSPEPERIIKFYSEAFGPDDPDFNQLSLVHTKVQRLQSALKSNDFSSVFPMMEMKDENPTLAAMLAPVFLDAIHKSAERAIKGKDPETALSLLSHVEFTRRTPTTHSLMIDALKQIPPPAPNLVRNRDLMSLLVRMSEKDIVLRDVFVSLLEQCISYYLQRSLPDGSDEYLQTLIRVRPDPDKRNDDIRMKQVLAYIKQGREESVQAKLRELREPISFFSQVRLFMARVRSNQETRLAIAIACILGLGLFGIRMRHKLPELSFKRKVPENKLYAEGSGMSDEEYEKVRPQFVTLRGGVDPANREYHKCLETFGLTSEAKLQDIKAAYRNIIKGLHPDHQKGIVDPDRFIEIKAAYERLLEIRKAKGLD